MSMFFVPEYQSVAHFVLGVLLDRASLHRAGIDGEQQITISLVKEDIILLKELGVIDAAGDPLALEQQNESSDVDDLVAMRREFETQLIDLQEKTDAALAKARMRCGGVCPDFS